MSTDLIELVEEYCSIERFSNKRINIKLYIKLIHQTTNKQKKEIVQYCQTQINKQNRLLIFKKYLVVILEICIFFILYVTLMTYFSDNSSFAIFLSIALFLNLNSLIPNELYQSSKSRNRETNLNTLKFMLSNTNSEN